MPRRTHTPLLPRRRSAACRVGLLPLRKRPLEYYVVINGGASSGQQNGAANGTTHGAGTRAAAAKAATAAAIAAAAAANGSEGLGDRNSAEGSEEAGGHHAKKPRGAQRSVAEAAPDPAPKQQQLAGPSAEADAANGKPAKPLPPRLRQPHHDSAGSVLAKLPAGASMRPTAVTFTRKRAQAETAAPDQQQQQLHNSPAKRASQRLGGLSGPVGGGLLGTFGKHGNAGI